MKKFGPYLNTNSEQISQKWLDRLNFGDAYSPFCSGAGYGFIYGGTYCSMDGRGEGSGFYSGDGSQIYPFELIQYWKE